MQIKINDVLRSYIEPLTEAEYAALERSILVEGCRDALVLWEDVLVDGHNRYQICQQHGVPFKVTENTSFRNLDDVKLWMIDNNLGRRSISDFQRGVLALRKREILSQRRERGAAASPASASASSQADQADQAGHETVGATAHGAASTPAPAAEPAPLKNRTDIARAARLSSNQVVMIEKIQTQAVPELVAAVKQGTISLNAAAAVASLPAEEQKAAALAGKDELKQAAKRVREVKRKPTPEREASADTEGCGEAPWEAANGAPDELQALRQRVAELTAENEALRQQNAALQARLAA